MTLRKYCDICDQPIREGHDGDTLEDSARASVGHVNIDLPNTGLDDTVDTHTNCFIEIIDEIRKRKGLPPLREKIGR